jgi:hypothetical protein
VAPAVVFEVGLVAVPVEEEDAVVIAALAVDTEVGFALTGRSMWSEGWTGSAVCDGVGGRVVVLKTAATVS